MAKASARVVTAGLISAEVAVFATDSAFPCTCAITGLIRTVRSNEKDFSFEW